MSPNTQFSNILDAFVAELIATPDDQILDGVNSNAEKASGLAILRSARKTVGQNRLEAAKAGAAAASEKSTLFVRGSISVEEARQYVLSAANDSRFTLAARELNELSDDAVLKLYSQIKALEQSGSDGGPDK